MAGAAHPPEHGARHVPRGWTLGQEDGAASTCLLAPRDQGTGQAYSGQKAGRWPLSCLQPPPGRTGKGSSGLVSLALWLGARVGRWGELQGVRMLPSQRWLLNEKG